LLLDTASLPSCYAEVVDHIVQSDFASIELLVFNGGAGRHTDEARPARSLIRKAIDTLLDGRLRRGFLFGLYQRWDLRNVDPATGVSSIVSRTMPSSGFARRSSMSSSASASTSCAAKS
jgi:hypothetical protein